MDTKTDTSKNGGTPSDKAETAFPKGVDSKLGVQIGENGPSIDLIWSKEAHYPLPVMVYFFSDTFVSADSKRGLPLCGFLAKRGYMVLNVTLRPLSEDMTVEEELNDIVSVFRWISENSKEYGLDPGSIYVTGTLYGGFAALWSAVLFRTLRIRDLFDVPDLDIRITGAGLFCGYSDPNSLLNRLTRPFPKAFRKIAHDNPLLASCLRLWDNHDIRTMPPIFQVCAMKSPTYPDAVKLEELLKTNAVTHELLLFPSGDEGFSIFPELHPESAYSTRAVSKMLNLFQTHQ